MMILLPGLLMLRGLSPRQLLELRERGTVSRLHGAARELDAGHGRIAARKREQRGANAREIRALRAATCFDRGGERSDQAVREENAEEGSDERRGDLLADLRCGAADRGHRDDDAEHR